MVVVEAEGGRVALLVDELLGQQQVVVKNLEANYRKVDDVSGATIMGDGRVALILDVGALVRRLAPLIDVTHIASRRAPTAPTSTQVGAAAEARHRARGRWSRFTATASC